MAANKTQGKSGNPAKRGPVPKPVMTGDQQFQLAKMKVRNWGHGILGIFVCLVILSSWPVASEFAGKQTGLNIAMSLSFMGVAAAIGAVGGIWGNHHRLRANRLDERNGRLGRIVHILRDRVTDLGGNPDVAEDVDMLTAKGN